MEDRDATLTLRIESSLKTSFEEICRNEDRTPSQMVRGMIRQFVTGIQEQQKPREPKPPVVQEKTTAPGKPKKGQRMAEAAKRALHRD